MGVGFYLDLGYSKGQFFARRVTYFVKNSPGYFEYKGFRF